jgi:hypothetical protein
MEKSSISGKDLAIDLKRTTICLRPVFNNLVCNADVIGFSELWSSRTISDSVIESSSVKAEEMRLISSQLMGAENLITDLLANSLQVNSGKNYSMLHTVPACSDAEWNFAYIYQHHNSNLVLPATYMNAVMQDEDLIGIQKEGISNTGQNRSVLSFKTIKINDLSYPAGSILSIRYNNLPQDSSKKSDKLNRVININDKERGATLAFMRVSLFALHPEERECWGGQNYRDNINTGNSPTSKIIKETKIESIYKYYNDLL